jgi:hypothetical protein
MALIKNTTQEQRIMRLAAKLCLAAKCESFLSKQTAESLELSDEQFDILVAEFENVAQDLKRHLEPVSSIKGNIQIARKYILDEQ